MSNKTQMVHWSAEDFTRFIDAAEARGYRRAIDVLRTEAERRDPTGVPLDDRLEEHSRTAWAVYVTAAEYLEANRDG